MAELIIFGVIIAMGRGTFVEEDHDCEAGPRGCRMNRWALASLCLSLSILAHPAAAGIDTVQKWDRYEAANFTDSDWGGGNPFDVDFTGAFVSPTGRQLTQFGFYAGDDRWKLWFMCDEPGTWSYSFDGAAELSLPGNDSFECVPNTNPEIQGQLEAASVRKWKLSDGEYVSPIIIPFRRFWMRNATTGCSDSSGKCPQDAIDWADETVRALLVGQIFLVCNHPQESKAVDQDDVSRLYLPMFGNIRKRIA